MYEHANIWAKQCGHETLKRRRPIAVPLLYDIAEKCAEYRSDEPGPRHMFLYYSDLFECLGHIEFRSERCTSHILSYAVLIRERGFVVWGTVRGCPGVAGICLRQFETGSAGDLLGSHCL